MSGRIDHIFQQSYLLAKDGCSTYVSRKDMIVTRFCDASTYKGSSCLSLSTCNTIDSFFSER